VLPVVPDRCYEFYLERVRGELQAKAAFESGIRVRSIVECCRDARAADDFTIICSVEGGTGFAIAHCTASLISFCVIVPLDIGSHHRADSVCKIKIDNLRQEFTHPLLSNTIYIASYNTARHRLVLSGSSGGLTSRVQPARS
jgi:hypothetical protein